jgi:hypothetical protein
MRPRFAVLLSLTIISSSHGAQGQDAGAPVILPTVDSAVRLERPVLVEPPAPVPRSDANKTKGADGESRNTNEVFNTAIS